MAGDESSPADYREVIREIPGYDPYATAGDCTFDNKAAHQAIQFIESLNHIKGAKGGTKIELEPWQKAIVANLFGWKRPDGTRRYREVFVFVPRKNGKSLMAAALVLCVLFTDAEPGAEIYSAAADRDQAALVFDVAKSMVLGDDELSGLCKVYQKAITREELGSSYKAISRDANTKHGYNAHCVIIDELHAQPNRDLVDVLMTSTGARRQPMVVHITTAGFDRNSICYLKYDQARRVRDAKPGDTDNDPSFLPVIYEAPAESDWTDEKTWFAANPNLDVSVSLDYLRRECQHAKDSPAYQNTFKRLHLNIWTEQDVRWLDMSKWDLCGLTPIEAAELEGRECYAGLDLASTNDVAALVLLFPVEDA